MNGHLAFVDASALRSISNKHIEHLIEASFKLQGASCQRNHFALLDLDCDGSLLARLQHAGCKARIAEITRDRQQQGQPYDSQKSLATILPTLCHITEGNGLKILLAAQESTGSPKLHNLQHGWKLHSKQLYRLGVDNESADCVSMLTKLPSSLEDVKAFLYLPAGIQGADEQLPDPEADEQAFITAAYKRCQQLLGDWLQFFRDRNVRLLLLATGFDETEASKAEILLAYSLYLLLLTECPAGSCVCPISSSESSDGDTWELDRSWPKYVLKHVLQAAGQTGCMEELKAKIQALKLPKDVDGDKWVQQQHESFKQRSAKQPTGAAKPREETAAVAQQIKPTASGAGSVGAPPPPPAAVGNGEARKRMRRTAAQGAAAAAAAAAAAVGGTCPPPRQPLKPAAQNHQQVQPANSASVGCPAGSQAGGSRRSGSQPAGGFRAVVSHAARRLMAASDQPQKTKQQRKVGAAGLVAERALGLGTHRSTVGKDGASLLQPVQLGGSQEPNSSAFTAGSSRQQRLGSQRELIPPINLAAAAAVDANGDAAAPAAEGAAGQEAVAAGTQGTDKEVATTILVKDTEHQPAALQQHQRRASPAATGCLVAANLDGNAAAEVATAAVKVEVERLLAGRNTSGSLRTKHVPRLKEDLVRLNAVAVKALVQHCPEDQQQWSYGISAAAREAVLYAKQELERMKDSSLKKLAHELNGHGEAGATAAAKTAGLPEPDAAAIRRARLRQGLLVLTGRSHYLHHRMPGVHVPEVVLQPAFWTLFCLHSMLVVGPLVDPPVPAPDMENDGTRWSAKIQYVTAEDHIDWFLDQVNMAWDLWAFRIRKQQQQQHEAAASPDKPASNGDAQEQQGSQQPLLLFGVYADAYEWFSAVVLPGLESQEWLVGLCMLLSKWKNVHKREEGSMHVPRQVDFDTQHQLGDPTLLGAAMLQDIRRQEEQQRKERRRALRNYEKEEAVRKKLEAQGAGEGVGMTDGVPGDAVVAAAAGGGARGDKKRRNEDEVESGGGSATKATKRHCPGIEVTSKPAAAAAGRPSRVNSAALLKRKPGAAAANDPLKALKNLKGLPGKNKLRLNETQAPKKQQRQKPKHPRDLKEVEDDADSTQRKQKRKSAATAAAGGGDSVPGSGGTTAANDASGAAAAAGGSGGAQKAKEPNKFARQKVVKQPPVQEKQDDLVVEAELAGFGLDIGGDTMQPKQAAIAPTAGFAAVAAGVAAGPAAANAKRLGIFGVAGVFGGPPKQQQQLRVSNSFSFLAARPAIAAPVGTVAVAAPATTAAIQQAAGASAAAPAKTAAAASAAPVPETPGEKAPPADDQQADPDFGDVCPATADAEAAAAANQHLAGQDAGQTPSRLEVRFAAAAATDADCSPAEAADTTAVNAGVLAAEPQQLDQEGSLQVEQPAQHVEQHNLHQQQLAKQDASQQEQGQEQQALAASSRKRKAGAGEDSSSKRKPSSAAQQEPHDFLPLSPAGQRITRRKSAELQVAWQEHNAQPSARPRHAGARTPTVVVLPPLAVVESRKSNRLGSKGKVQPPQQQQQQQDTTAAPVDKPAAVAVQQHDMLDTKMASTAVAELPIATLNGQRGCIDQQEQVPGTAEAGPAISHEEQLNVGDTPALDLPAVAGAAEQQELEPAAAAAPAEPADTDRRKTRRTAAAAAAAGFEQQGLEAGLEHVPVAAGTEATIPAHFTEETAPMRSRSTRRGKCKERQQQQDTLSSPAEAGMIQAAAAAAAEGPDRPLSAGTRHADKRRSVLFCIKSPQQTAAPGPDEPLDVTAAAACDAGAAAVDAGAAAVDANGPGAVRVGRGRRRSRSRNQEQNTPEAAAAAAGAVTDAAADVVEAGTGTASTAADVSAVAAASTGTAGGTLQRRRSTSRQHQQQESAATAAGSGDCDQAAAADAAATVAPRRSRRVAGGAASEPQPDHMAAGSKPTRGRDKQQQSQQQQEADAADNAHPDHQQQAVEVETSVGTAGKVSKHRRRQRVKRQQLQLAGEITPPAAAASAGEGGVGQCLLSPVDVDLENGQGEEEQPQGEDDMMQQPPAEEPAAAAGAGDLDDTVEGAAAAVGPVNPAAAAAGKPAVADSPAAAAAGIPTCQTPAPDSALGDSPVGFTAELQMYQRSMTLEHIQPLTTGVRSGARRMTRQDSSMMSLGQLGLTSRLEDAAAAPGTHLTAAAAQPAVNGQAEDETGINAPQKQGLQQDGQQHVSGCDHPGHMFGCSRCRYAKNGCIGCNPAKVKASKRRKAH